MSVKVTGLDEINRRFDALTGSKQRQYIRQGARAAGSALIKETKPRIPDRKSRDEKGKLVGLKRSMQQIPSSRWRNAADLRAKGIIGTRVGFKRAGSHAHLVEFGHQMVTNKKNGKRTVGFVQPKPFMRPAMDAAKSQMHSAFRKKILAGIEACTK